MKQSEASDDDGESVEFIAALLCEGRGLFKTDLHDQSDHIHAYVF